MIFVDGSCSKHEGPSSDRVAWAAVVLDNEGNEAAILSDPVWRSLPQTSSMAEFVTIAGIISDYSGAIAAFLAGRRACGQRRRFSGITWSGLTADSWHHVAEIMKMEATQTYGHLPRLSPEWALARSSASSPWLRTSWLLRRSCSIYGRRRTNSAGGKGAAGAPISEAQTIPRGALVGVRG